MRIVFMGTPDFAVPSLSALLDAGHDVCGVFTQPDRPKGRGYTLTPPPIKELAVERGIAVFQPTTLKDGKAESILRTLRPDAIVVVAYGKILPPAILRLPPFGCVNVHASLLPRYRGAAPIQWSILRGETITGVTTMLMDEGLDTGEMLLRSETPIAPDETAQELHDRLAGMGAALICDTLAALARKEIHPIPQDDAQATYAPMLTKELSLIDWNDPADVVHNRIRGLSPWPCAQTKLSGRPLKIYRSRPGAEAVGEPGSVCGVNPFSVTCGDGRSVELVEVQGSGGKRMRAADFLRGHPVEPGTKLI